MKTIKEPSPPQAQLYHLECGSCRAVMECEKWELKYVYDQREREEWWDLVCPHCEKVTHFGVVSLARAEVREQK